MCSLKECVINRDNEFERQTEREKWSKRETEMGTERDHHSNNLQDKQKFMPSSSTKTAASALPHNCK